MDRDLELRHLRYFVAVAEELHFGRAAHRLHLSQPPLSQQIRALEEIIGYPLFVRTSRSVRLTPAGEALLERARRTLRNVQRDLDEIRTLGSGEVGSLHIGFVGSAMLATLPAIFRVFRETYPRVHLQLHESYTAHVIQGLENGTLDAGILRDGDSSPTLDITTLFIEPFIAVLPVNHRLAARAGISPADLRDGPFVYFPRIAGTRAFGKAFSLCEEHGFQPRVVQEGTHWVTILRLIGAGLGVTLAPACVRRIASPEVVCLDLPPTNILSAIELATRSGETQPLVAHFTHIATTAPS